MDLLLMWIPPLKTNSNWYKSADGIELQLKMENDDRPTNEFNEKPTLDSCLSKEDLIQRH